MATIYLLHFTQPISPRHTAQHYLGVADNLGQRLALHRAGQGARLCAVARERGIAFVLARTWPGDRRAERRLKNQKNAPRLCPLCNRNHAQPELSLNFTLDDVAELEF